ncbi:hypothetical protein PQO03_02005 [Lentisphaera profundi]|uniref:Lipoprotein n=1 Tax=Lentisphaera profundi TaxID=1658616 RepID=A0ABY7VS62_9BACT|nr:hypothetical protein [Lentisphaera profundi]WDE96736.1 hypothetical protein PQO03_02005 [Lentisphaera profundi]
MMQKKISLYFFSFLTFVLTSSCSWIDRNLAQSHGEYFQTFNCTQETALLSTKQIITEKNYTGVIINHDGNHAEIWFKLNDKQRVRVRFTQHYFWDTIISYYVSPDGNEDMSDEFYTTLHQKIFGTALEKS